MSKANVGDIAVVYLSKDQAGRYNVSKIKADYYLPFDIVGKNPSQNKRSVSLAIGTKDIFVYNFWSLDNYNRAFDEKIKNLSDYKTGYWLYHSDILVKQIIRK